MAAGVIDDVLMRHAMAGQFPGGQGALIAGASLVDPNMQRDAGVGGLINRAGGGAPIDGGDPAGVTMGQDAHRFAGRLGVRDFSDQAEAMFADPTVDGDILIGDFIGQGSGRRRPRGRRQIDQRGVAAVECPFQIDRRRPCLDQPPISLP